MFNAKKATDMAIHLLKKSGGVDDNNYTKILKLMYLAERESYAKYGEPMCGDDMFSLPHGPILSRVADFIRNKFHTTEWCEMISTKGYTLVLNDPQTQGYRKLSRAEKRILDEQWKAHQYRTYAELCKWTHQHCPEWDETVTFNETPYKCTSIELPNLLKFVGINDNDLDATLEHLEELRGFSEATSHWE